LQKRARFFSTPSLWDAFRNLNQVAFPLAKCANPREDQFFAMGDNSPQSLDSRLWQRSPGMKTTKLFDPNNPEPGRICQRPDREYYVERDLLIGKALLIYWPLNQWGFVR
jgi:signal peptidase I